MESSPYIPRDRFLERLAHEVASDPQAPEARVVYLIGALGIGPKPRARLLEHPRLTLPTLYQLAGGDRESFPCLRDNPSIIRELRWGAARHSNASPQLLRILTTLDDGRYDSDVARNRNVTPQILEHLAMEHRAVCVVAAHPKSPEHAIRRLYETGEKEVLKAVGRNRRAPIELLVAISRHETRFVRAAAAGNRALPRAELERLVTDESPLVRKTAIKTWRYRRYRR